MTTLMLILVLLLASDALSGMPITSISLSLACITYWSVRIFNHFSHPNPNEKRKA